MKPKFCPNCGKEFNDESLVKLFTGLVFNHNEKNEITVHAKGWGIECSDCEWSGEILCDI
ncbi:hypothetical protein [Cytobacillus firmus]|uniref:Uncharacterized protein n=1 Tax=Cytobacillus firmus TaxID=1399 RepID=A0AA46P2T0_CYTFI|nr:hypothetical protein [Cytobacillus firmus]KML36602.1 hypothetical protein VL14_20495 [Cytobacillus firmus]MCS0653243.1 hypothetical protein [Cytobacillus firmus]UYG95516.1 hypothetical protein OD459_00380 [Cytobacillus firmus]